jgi:hypothetical protein
MADKHQRRIKESSEGYRALQERGYGTGCKRDGGKYVSNLI